MTERDHAVEQPKFWKSVTLQSVAPIVIVCLAGLGVMVPVLLLPYALDGHDSAHHILRLITCSTGR